MQLFEGNQPQTSNPFVLLAVQQDQELPKTDEPDFKKLEQSYDYSDRYADDENEFRMVTLPRTLVPYIKKKLQPDGTLKEETWRGMLIKQSRGWQNCGFHQAEPHILLFKRSRCTDAKTGKPSEEIKKKLEAQLEEDRQELLQELMKEL